MSTASAPADVLLSRACEFRCAAQLGAEQQLWSATAASAIRAGKSAADAIALSAAGRTVTDVGPPAAAGELGSVLRGGGGCVYAESALLELMSSEATVCRGHEPTSEASARALLSHAQTLVAVAQRVVGA